MKVVIPGNGTLSQRASVGGFARRLNELSGRICCREIEPGRGLRTSAVPLWVVIAIPWNS